MALKETSGEKSGSKNGELVKQEHGGALRHGSLPGNTPGSGRPPRAIRERFRDLADRRGVEVLEEVMTGRVEVPLVGKCPECQYVRDEPLSGDEIKRAIPRGTERRGLRYRFLKLAVKLAAVRARSLDVTVPRDPPIARARAYCGDLVAKCSVGDSSF